MNNRQINNKNMKRVAIAAGATAAALFLAAGFVASRGDDSGKNADAVSAIEMLNQAVELPNVDTLTAMANEILEAAPVESAAGDSTKSASTTKSVTTSVKRAKSKSSSTSPSSDIIFDVPAVSETNSVVETTIAPATQQADASNVEAPAQQTVAADQQTTAAAPAAQETATQAPAPTATGGTTAVSIPKWTYTATSPIAGTNLTATRVTIPSCIPGFNC